MSRGPVPKRSSERRRKNVDSRPEVVSFAGGPVVAPALRPGLHPLAVAWYEALGESGQSRFYEPSDWMQAQVIAEGIDQFARKPRGNLLATILSGSASLLVTEGDRRRLRVELARVDSEALSADERAEATVLDLQRRLSQA